MQVSEATPDDLPAVLNVLDGAALSVDIGVVRAGIERDGTIVAVADESDRVVGALVLDGDRIDAVAVRRRRRGQGIGTALVRAAIERRDRLTAAFDADVRPFYESLGFTVEPAEEPGRYRGVFAPS